MSESAKTFLLQSDPILADIIRTLPEPVFESSGNVFMDLMSCVIEQQIHYRSTKKFFQKLLEKAGLTELTPSNFPEFEKKALVGIKISTGKFETILRILDFWSNHTIDWQTLSDEQVFEKLSTIKGVGRWTIEMILLFTLGRPDVFPSDDYHLKIAMTKLYGLNPNTALNAQMMEVAERWSGHRSLAVKHVLAWKKGKGDLNSFDKNRMF